MVHYAIPRPWKCLEIAVPSGIWDHSRWRKMCDVFLRSLIGSVLESKKILKSATCSLSERAHQPEPDPDFWFQAQKFNFWKLCLVQLYKIKRILKL